MAMLELADISKGYRLGPVETEVLKGIRPGVKAGDPMSIMGPSESGKSTLMHLPGLLGHPTASFCRIGGRDVSTMNGQELSIFHNTHIGFAFQSFNLWWHLTAFENAALPLVHRGTGRWRYAAAQEKSWKEPA